MYYITFVLLMLNNFFLYQYLRKKNRMTQEQKFKQLAVSITFAVSYLYRSICDSIQDANSSLFGDLQMKNGDWNYGWYVQILGLSDCLIGVHQCLECISLANYYLLSFFSLYKVRLGSLKAYLDLNLKRNRQFCELDSKDVSFCQVDGETIMPNINLSGPD